MKILHIVAGMPPESGVAAVVTRLAVEQQGLGHEVCVASTEKRKVLKFESSKVLKCEEVLKLGKVRVVTFRRNWPHFLFFSWGMMLGLGKMVKDADVVHVHSNWTFPVWWGAWLALRQKKTLVMSPHGSFNPLQLKHSGWKKAAVAWMDRWLLRRASVVHATCGEEKRWVQAFLECANARMRECVNELETAPKRPRIVVIPNGIGICENAQIRECGREMRECLNARMREFGE